MPQADRVQAPAIDKTNPFKTRHGNHSSARFTPPVQGRHFKIISPMTGDVVRNGPRRRGR
jgi:hypothetical protein